MISESAETSPARVQSPATLGERVAQFFADYFWFILKNVIGWLLILAAWPIGLLVPGPGGIPIFLIGFALVTFPGKRKLTARVLRGRTMQLDAGLFTAVAAALALIIPAALMWWVAIHYRETIESYSLGWPVLIAICFIAVGVTWLVARLSFRFVNWLLRNVPRGRRFVRPWLRRKGIHLLPPRRARHGRQKRGRVERAAPGYVTPAPATQGQPAEHDEEEEIIEIHARHFERMGRVWSFGKVWGRRAVGVAITVLIFVYILKPIREQWPTVKDGILQTSLGGFLLAAVMFAIFLAFRALSWRRILIGFGHRLPFAPALRIWTTSELARYLPGAVWQVIGRVYLVRPYGVSGSVCTTSQILEVSVFLLANLLVAVACLIYFAAKINPVARPWLYAAMVLVPVLGFVLHPKIFYGVINKILQRLGREPIVQRLSGFALTRLLLRLVVALLWQSFAVYILVQPVLHLKPDWWWMVAGAYCLAWSAGFLAIWAPGGIGVRELVFIAAMQIVLPPHLEVSRALLGYLAVLLRLWTMAGEFLLAAVAYAIDYRGALGRSDAPGRVSSPAVVSAVEEPAELLRR